jgi:hypothetical protein
VSKAYFVKQLRLTPVDLACQLDIPVEAPVFLSPNINRQERCRYCPVLYGAIVYQTGYVAAAHHWHERTGGIYFYVRYSGYFHGELVERTGWLARIEPLGKTWIEDTCCGCFGRAEAVRCISISAWCMASAWGIRSVVPQPHKPHPIDHGCLLRLPLDHDHAGLLVPLCDQAEVPERYTPLRFHIRDGAVFFSQRPSP